MHMIRMTSVLVFIAGIKDVLANSQMLGNPHTVFVILSCLQLY